MTSLSLEDQTHLPTLDRLHANCPEAVNVQEVASAWFQSFSEAISSRKTDLILGHFVDFALWRDLLALTWHMRTFHGTSRIRKFLDDRLSQSGLENLRISDDRDKQITVLDVPGLYWIQGFFDFDTAAGIGSGVFRLVPTANRDWKAHTVFTNLESLKGVPYQVGFHRSWESNHGEWLNQRANEIMSFERKSPTVLIVGGGHSGLGVAARLKYLGVSCLLVEKNPRIGDSWRNRYESLCLHDPVWVHHMPFLKFPDSWPVYPPAAKLADWLEFYARALELNVWTSTQVMNAQRDETNNSWIATISKADGSTQVMYPKYIVFALGFGGNVPHFPTLPGMHDFRGEIIHSMSHHTAADHIGKKVIVIGACTAAHDVSEDFCRHGVDTTMVQRSSTYIISIDKGIKKMFQGVYDEHGPSTEVADLMGASIPFFLGQQLNKRTTAEIAELDSELLEGLNRVGFQTNLGYKGSGFRGLALRRMGGYYFDSGASQLIVDGKIKLKHGDIKRFTREGVEFKDGSFLEADLVVFATGLGDVRDVCTELLGKELTSKLKPLWGFNKEGELNGLYCDCGLPNMYFTTGGLGQCRFYSTHIALQIKGRETGLFTSAYGEDC